MIAATVPVRIPSLVLVYCIHALLPRGHVQFQSNQKHGDIGIEKVQQKPPLLSCGCDSRGFDLLLQVSNKPGGYCKDNKHLMSEINSKKISGVGINWRKQHSWPGL